MAMRCYVLTAILSAMHPGEWTLPQVMGTLEIPSGRTENLSSPQITFAMAVSATAKAAFTPATVRCAGVLLWR